MKIRTRLIVVLLTTALVPLLITSIVHQTSIRLARQRLAKNTQSTLDRAARQTLQEYLHGHVEVMIRERQLAQALLTRQAREIELALSAALTPASISPDKTRFGFDPNLFVVEAQIHPFFLDVNDPNVVALDIDFQRQSVLFDAPNTATETLQRLSGLTALYHDTYTHAPQGTLWISTRLTTGLVTRYPAGGKPLSAATFPRDRGNRDGRGGRPGRRDADGSSRPPARPEQGSVRRGRRGGEGPRRREPVLVDPQTGQIVVSISVPLRGIDGAVIGQTSLMRTVPEVFTSIALPERWGTDTERMIIQVDPNAVEGPSARILLHDNLRHSERRGRRRVVLGTLQSADTEAFQTMIGNIAAGESGVERMDYLGKPYLWAYRPGDVEHIAALLLVPYDRVTELAQTLEATLLAESLFWFRFTSAIFVLTALVATAMAFKKAKSITQPIQALIDAGQELARGNYHIRVRIETGDELEQLRDVFNDTGPKLLERQRMKRSLELAGAVQQNLFPKQTPTLQRFEMAGLCHFCDETGGDCYDFLDLPEDHPQKHGVLVGDVSGHGIGAALLMSAIRSHIHAEARHYGDDLPPLLTRVNQRIVQDTEAETFATLFYAVIDDKTCSVTCSSAGHDPALWYHTETQTLEELPNTGMVLGVLEDVSFEQSTRVTLEPQDVLIIGTDGIWEARNAQDEMYGKDRFHQLIRETAQHGPADICARVLDSVTHFIGSAARTADATLVVIKAKSTYQNESPH